MGAAKLEESYSQNKFNEVSSVNNLSDFTFDLMTCIKLCPKDLLGLLGTPAIFLIFFFLLASDTPSIKLFCWNLLLFLL